MREGVLAVTVAEWTRDIALILSGVAGFLHWAWWIPLLCGASAALMREASQGFVLTGRAFDDRQVRFPTVLSFAVRALAKDAHALRRKQ